MLGHRLKYKNLALMQYKTNSGRMLVTLSDQATQKVRKIIWLGLNPALNKNWELRILRLKKLLRNKERL